VESIFLKAVNTNQKMVGGLSAYTFYGCLVIDVIWIEPCFRRKGIGMALIQNAEILAKKKGLSMISVSTMEWWEATQFYKKCGFCIEFVRKGFRGGFKQYHLIKHLLKQNENKNY
jgi:GNAT superfamily N-acetyltransferase